MAIYTILNCYVCYSFVLNPLTPVQETRCLLQNDTQANNPMATPQVRTNSLTNMWHVRSNVIATDNTAKEIELVQRNLPFLGLIEVVICEPFIELIVRDLCSHLVTHYRDNLQDMLCLGHGATGNCERI